MVDHRGHVGASVPTPHAQWLEWQRQSVQITACGQGTETDHQEQQMCYAIVGCPVPCMRRLTPSLHALHTSNQFKKDAAFVGMCVRTYDEGRSRWPTKLVEWVRGRAHVWQSHGAAAG